MYTSRIWLFSSSVSPSESSEYADDVKPEMIVGVMKGRGDSWLRRVLDRIAPETLMRLTCFSPGCSRDALVGMP